MHDVASCLIGSTGFVGGNLARAWPFDVVCNSSTIRTIRGRQFGLVVCAAPHARKWWANLHPDEDRAMVDSLVQDLGTIRAERFVLLSTIDVFPVLTNADETFDCGGVGNHAYGRNRLGLENFVAKHFAAAHIVRLPGLFGPGLKKNAIYDLLHDNDLDKVNPESIFQWYDVRRLWADIRLITDAAVRRIVLATEPVRTEDIRARLFPDKRIGGSAGAPVRYDIRTVHSGLFGGREGYIMGRQRVLDLLADYVETERVPG